MTASTKNSLMKTLALFRTVINQVVFYSNHRSFKTAYNKVMRFTIWTRWKMLSYSKWWARWWTASKTIVCTTFYSWSESIRPFKNVLKTKPFLRYLLIKSPELGAPLKSRPLNQDWWVARNKFFCLQHLQF